jgi:hypothetical protein
MYVVCIRTFAAGPPTEGMGSTDGYFDKERIPKKAGIYMYMPLYIHTNVYVYGYLVT